MRKMFLIIAMASLSLCVYADDSIAVAPADTIQAVSADSVSAVPADSVLVIPEENEQEPVAPNLLDSMPGVQVIQDSALARILQVTISGNEEWIEVSGYRVQVYSSNQQQKAKAEALRLEDRLKDQLNQTVYVQYVPPFWKVRIGDFRTYDEAKEYKRQVVQQFPGLVGDTYIVRDQIKVLK